MEKVKTIMPKLHIFLGAGGVGKTTLSAGFAAALARSGRKVALLSIDPAKRLQGALSAGDLPELGKTVFKQGNGELRASLLLIGEGFRRWVLEQGLSKETEEKLFENVMFRGIADRFATSSDTFAAVRMAEWLEKWPELDDLVIDTAPGIHAADFLTKPAKLTEFLDSKLVDWLKAFVSEKDTKVSVWQRVVKAGARKVLDGLAQVGGQSFLLNFGEFLILLDEVIVTMISRLERAKIWMRSKETTYYLVTAVRDDAVRVTFEFARLLQKLEASRVFVAINRAFPDSLKDNKGYLDFLREHADAVDFKNHANFFANFLSSYSQLQDTVKLQLENLGTTVVELPIASQLDAAQDVRIDDLAFLGDLLRNKVNLC